MTARGIGEFWEDAALAFVQKAGLQLVARNFRCRYGEIDLILRDGDTLVFAEVRYRHDAARGDGTASVGPAKQRKLPDEDWLEQDTLVCCPDPDERVVMRIARIGERIMQTEELT